MAKMTVAEILRKCSEFKKKEERVEALRINCNEACKIVLQYMFHPQVKFLLPEGKPPFKYSEFDEPTMLYKEARKLYHFIDGGNPNLSPLKRESMFIDILQVINSDDADLLIAMKDKVSPYSGITQDVAYAAFPELFPT